MSFAAAHESKVVRRLCQACRERKARFQYRGRVRADRHHVLCFECYRSERERLRAQVLSEIPAAMPIRCSGPSRLTQREITHREQMLRHLSASSGVRALPG